MLRRSSTGNPAVHLVQRGIDLMKRFALLLFVSCATSCIFGQSLPVKSGLWENTVYDDNGKPSVKALNCYTPNSFAEMLSNTGKHPGCKITNQTMTNKSITVDVSCDRPKVQMSSHGVLSVIDSEHVTSTTTIKMTVNGQTRNSSMKASAQFKSANCGDVKPGDPKILN